MAERWRQLVLGTKTDHTRDNFLWNMIGSALYALATIVLVRITRGPAGTGVGADFNIALKTGQILLTIGYFEIRPFQVTDVAGEYSFQEYYSFRFLTCGAMAVSGVLFPWLKGESGVRFALFALLCLYKLMDGAADVYEGEFQKQGRMDLAGKSVAFRTLLSVGAYGAAAAVTGNVALSVCVMVLAAALGVLLFDAYGQYGAFVCGFDFVLVYLQCLGVCGGYGVSGDGRSVGGYPLYLRLPVYADFGDLSGLRFCL